MGKEEQKQGNIGVVVENCSLDLSELDLPRDVKTAILVLIKNILK